MRPLGFLLLLTDSSSLRANARVRPLTCHAWLSLCITGVLICPNSLLVYPTGSALHSFPSTSISQLLAQLCDAWVGLALGRAWRFEFTWPSYRGAAIGSSLGRTACGVGPRERDGWRHYYILLSWFGYQTWAVWSEPHFFQLSCRGFTWRPSREAHERQSDEWHQIRPRLVQHPEAHDKLQCDPSRAISKNQRNRHALAPTYLCRSPHDLNCSTLWLYWYRLDGASPHLSVHLFDIDFHGGSPRSPCKSRVQDSCRSWSLWVRKGIR